MQHKHDNDNVQGDLILCKCSAVYRWRTPTVPTSGIRKRGPGGGRVSIRDHRHYRTVQRVPLSSGAMSVMVEEFPCW